MDGVQRTSSPTAYTWPSGGGEDDIRYLTWQASIDERIDGRWQMVVIAEALWTDAEHAMLNEDPFGPFRMAKRVIGLASAVAAIPTIHLTMPPYIPAMR